MSTRRTFLKQGCFSSATLALPPRLLAALPETREGSEALPAEYFRRMAKWCPVVSARLSEMHGATLAELEAQKGWYHFPYTVLPAAVLFAGKHPANPLYDSPQMRDLAFAIGDLIVREDKAGTFAPRLDSYRDVSLWLEAYGLLKPVLGAEREAAWRAVMERNVALLVPELMAWRDVAAYTENFLGTSPNHFAWWAATVMTGGILLGHKDWVTLGTYVLRRFATTEQNPDGYWGEHNINSPTGGYNYLTTLAVGLYYEHSRDPDALNALDRAMRFHTHTTYSDANLIELFNDRNRYWEVSPWGQFAFSHWPEGRSYAALLTASTPNDEIDLDTLGLLAQDALYYHSGPSAPCPQQHESFVYRLSAPAGVRKQGPWTVGLCGIVDTPLPNSQWFLERQAHLAVFHERTGAIISGANSKHQPELATFAQRFNNSWETAPRGGRLEQSATGDVLALAHNSFSAEIHIAPPTADELSIDVHINGRGPAPEEAFFGLQLHLTPGAVLTTAAGRKATIGTDTIHWKAEDIGGELRHGTWVLKLDQPCTLQWPVFPYNPYRNGPETRIEHAVAALHVPLQLATNPKTWLQIDEQIIRMRLSVPRSS